LPRSNPDEPKHAGATDVAGSLWWNWSPASDTLALIDTTGSTVDTVLAVYTGNSLASLTQVAAANDLGQSKQAYVSFAATRGGTYRIAVASVDTNSLGSIRVRVAPGGQLDTDPPAVSISSPLSGLLTHNKQITITGTASDPPANASGVKEVW